MHVQVAPLPEDIVVGGPLVWDVMADVTEAGVLRKVTWTTTTPITRV